MFCICQPASWMGASHKRDSYARAAPRRLPAGRFSPLNSRGGPLTKCETFRPKPFPTASAAFRQRRNTPRNWQPMASRRYTRKSKPRNYQVAIYALPPRRDSASPSFKLITQPSSLVFSSEISWLWAQTTARAPVSSGASRSSWYSREENITGWPRRP